MPPTLLSAFVYVCMYMYVRTYTHAFMYAYVCVCLYRYLCIPLYVFIVFINLSYKAISLFVLTKDLWYEPRHSENVDSDKIRWA